jgi:hypothetical protein
MEHLTCVVFTEDAPVHLLPNHRLKEIHSPSGQRHHALLCTSVLSEIPGFLALELVPEEGGIPSRPLVIVHNHHVLLMLQDEFSRTMGFHEAGISP